MISPRRYAVVAAADVVPAVLVDVAVDADVDAACVVGSLHAANVPLQTSAMNVASSCCWMSLSPASSLSREKRSDRARRSAEEASGERWDRQHREGTTHAVVHVPHHPERRPRVLTHIYAMQAPRAWFDEVRCCPACHAMCPPLNMGNVRNSVMSFNAAVSSRSDARCLIKAGATPQQHRNNIRQHKTTEDSTTQHINMPHPQRCTHRFITSCHVHGNMPYRDGMSCRIIRQVVGAYDMVTSGAVWCGVM